MKKLVISLLAGAGLLIQPALSLAQLPAQPFRVGQTPTQPQNSELTRFDLDFPGGTPANLVKAIEHAEQKPLNVIIPEDCANVVIPALKMNGITVQQLFEALMRASQKTENFVTGTYFGGINGQASSQYQTRQTYYGFRTEGAVTDHSVWYFFYERPPAPPGEIPPAAFVCRFFQMAPYLENYTIDDITTAIQTGWKLLNEGERNKRSNAFGGAGSAETPTLTFHKDTKLLIAAGDPEKLKLIDSVLQQLEVGKKAGVKSRATESRDEPAKK